jgi:hypothetical protein
MGWNNEELPPLIPDDEEMLYAVWELMNALHTAQIEDAVFDEGDPPSPAIRITPELREALEQADNAEFLIRLDQLVWHQR